MQGQTEDAVTIGLRFDISQASRWVDGATGTSGYRCWGAPMSSWSLCAEVKGRPTASTSDSTKLSDEDVIRLHKHGGGHRRRADSGGSCCQCRRRYARIERAPSSVDDSSHSKPTNRAPAKRRSRPFCACP
jgi:hypothetical protein